MKGRDTIALINNIVADYNKPKYNSIEDFYNSEISLLTMQIENLKRKVEYLRKGEFWHGKEKSKNKHC